MVKVNREEPRRWVPAILAAAIVAITAGCGGGAPVNPSLSTLLQVTPATATGVSGERERFSVSGVDGITRWDWTFGAAGSTAISSEATPEIVLNTPGIHQCSVRVRDGAGESAIAAFEVRIAARHNWEAQTLHPTLYTYNDVDDSQIVVIDGLPLVMTPIWDSGPHTVVYQATIPQPSNRAHWKRYTLGGPVPDLIGSSVVAVGDRPAIACYVSAEAPETATWLAQALTPHPQGPADWEFSAVSDHRSRDATVFNERLVLQQWSGNYPYQLHMVVAQVERPQGPADWIAIDSPSPVFEYDLLPTGDRLAAIYSVRGGANLLLFSAATTLVPPVEWSSHPILADHFPGEAKYTDSALVNGRPCVAYTLPKTVVVAQARHEFPTSAADWGVSKVPTFGDASSALVTDVGGRPAVIYTEYFDQHWFAGMLIGWNPTPGGIEDWQDHTVRAGFRTTSVVSRDDRLMLSGFESTPTTRFADRFRVGFLSTQLPE